ncbi:ankyrin repeat domain-containing protein, partial [Wolbachia pipientis]|uniref:ankyrin repeat domain-containing protein n=1 Tax=Wolbachia pipientis TaxID=955 RepID=UPI00202EFD9F
EILWKNGADPNVQDKHGKFLLHKAFLGKRDDIAKQLLEHGANPNIKDQEGKSLLCCVIDSHGDIDRYKAVELLLDKDVNPNVQDNQDRTPLHYLCSKYYEAGSVEIAKLLLRRGADPDSKDKSGKKPIDLVNPDSGIGKLFGAINYKKAFRFECATLLTTVSSIALISGVANAYIGKVWCSTLAVGTAAVALHCAYHAIKIMLFSEPSTEFTEARAEFLDSQKSPNPAGGA